MMNGAPADPLSVLSNLGGLLGGGNGASLGPILGAAPDPYRNTKALIDLARQCHKAAVAHDRWMYERVWWRNILYVLGRQWITYDGNANRWRDKRLHSFVPRPVTNKTAETVDAIASVYASVNLGITAAPVSQAPEDQSTAQTVNSLAAPIAAEHQMTQVMWEHDWWLLVTGNAFLHCWWDGHAEGQMMSVPLERCLDCQETHPPSAIVAAGNRCPSCGGAAMLAAPGQQDQLQFGLGRTDALSPLEIAVPTPYGTLAEMPFVIRKRWRLKGYYETHAPHLVNKIQWEGMPTDRSLQLLRGVSTQSEIGPSPGIFSGGESGTEEGCTEYELWHRPNKEFPDGVLLRFVEGSDPTIVDIQDEQVPGPLPLKDARGRRIIPFVHTRYERVGGRFWGRAPIDRLIHKQDQINQIDSLIQLIIMRTAAPVWAKPKGSGVRKFSGEPGFVMEYTPSGTQDNAPRRISGAEVPGSLFRIREMYYADFESLAGTYDIMKGQKPAGVEAFSALQLLVERSQSRFGPSLSARGLAYKQWFEIALELERQYGPEQRVWQAMGPNRQWTYEKFMHADLTGNVRIVVEDGAATPKTSLGKRAAIEQLRNLNVIDPRNPATAFRIAEVFGEPDLLPGIDEAVQAAQRVQSEFEQWAMTATLQPAMPTLDPVTGQMVPGTPTVTPPNPPGKRLPWQDAAVFIAEHRKWANSDRMASMLKDKPFLEQFVAWMIGQHELAQAQAAGMAMGGVAPAPGAQMVPPGAGGAQAMSSSNRESGAIGDVAAGVH